MKSDPIAESLDQRNCDLKNNINNNKVRGSTSLRCYQHNDDLPHHFTQLVNLQSGLLFVEEFRMSAATANLTDVKHL